MYNVFCQLSLYSVYNPRPYVLAMAASSSPSQPLLSHHDSPDDVVVLPRYPPPHRHILLRRSCRRCLFCFALLLVALVAAGYILWPYNPELSIIRLRLDRLHFHLQSDVSIDVTMDLRVKVRNPAVYPLDYDSLVVAIGYGGERLDFVILGGGVVKAREASYLNATLRVEISSDVVELIEDLEKGEVTLDAISEISGKLGIFSLQLPLKTLSKCGVTVNTWNQTIAHQDCYSEVTEL